MANKNDLILDIEKSLDQDAELQFQDYNAASSSSTAAANAAYVPPTTTSKSPANTSLPTDTTAPNPSTGKPFWTIEYYTQYFNVDTHDVVMRLLASVIPRQAVLESSGPHADLYGPFWITTTVIFLVFVCNTIGKSIQSAMNASDFVYDFTKLPASASTLYAFVSVVPLLIWALMRYFKFAATFTDVVCLYGYGLTVWIPLTLLSLVPYGPIHYLLGLIGLGVSIVYMMRNFYNVFGNAANDIVDMTRGKKISAGTGIFLFVLATEVALACVFMFWLFDVGAVTASNGPTATPTPAANKTA